MRLLLAVTGLLAYVALAGCAHQPPPTAWDPPGFFTGIWHGLIIFPSVLVGLFTEVRIYAFPNSGYWYDVGYFLGACFGVGGVAAGASAR